jgi:glycosyltransferase involved in cell wall biosynthesis
LKILFILPEYYPHSGGGISSYYLHYIKALAPNCTQIKVIAGSGYIQNESDYVLDGIEIEFLKPDIFKKYLDLFKYLDAFPEYQRNVAAAWAMWDQGKKGDGFDIIECTDFAMGYIPWLIHHQKFVVTRLHGSSGQIEFNEPDKSEQLFGNLNRFTELTLLPLSDLLIANSKSNQSFWQKLLKGIVIEHIYPVFDFEKVTISLKNKSENGIVTGRIQQWKGPDVLCAALENIPDEITIEWYGGDTKFNQQISKSTDLYLKFPSVWGKKIIPSPPVEQKELFKFQAAAKFGIVPSIWDTFNFTCLEYLAQGTIVICSDKTGVSELIDSGENGFKYAAENIEELSMCLNMVIKLTDVEYLTIATKAQDKLSVQLSPQMIIPQNIRLYNLSKTRFVASELESYLAYNFKPSSQNQSIYPILEQQALSTLIRYIYARFKGKIINLF